MTIIFVYGTLKRGYGNNARCLAGAKFLGNAVSVNKNFIMQAVGFPILWEGVNGGCGRVTGEIFEIDDKQLAACDRLEGHPRMYKREERKFFLHWPDTPEEIEAWVYLWNGPKKDGYADPIPLINGTYTWDIGH